MLTVAALAFFPFLMAYAAFSDLLTMTIANRVSALLVAGFAALALASGMGWSDLLIDHLSCGAALLAATFALFAFGWIGGGDAKLAASTAVWIGWGHLADYGVLASLVGGALTLGILALRRRELPAALARQPWAARIHSAASGVPYGIALAIAGLAVYPDTAIWTAAAGA